MVWGNQENILPQNLFTYVEKMEDYEIDLCVRGFHMYCNIYAMLSSGPPYVSMHDLWGCNDCMRLISSHPLPGCPSSLPPALLDSLEQLLELVLQTKVTLLGPVDCLCAAGTALEPFLSMLSCSCDCTV